MTKGELLNLAWISDWLEAHEREMQTLTSQGGDVPKRRLENAKLCYTFIHVMVKEETPT